MQGINTSLRARLLAVIGKLQEKKEKGMTSKQIAAEVVRHYAFREGITHKTPENKSNKVNPNAWVVIYQEVEDFVTIFKRSNPFLSEDEALTFFSTKWGENADESLLELMLHPVVFRPEMEELENAVNKIGEFIDTITAFQFDERQRWYGIPDGYESIEDYYLQIQGRMDLQLDVLVTELNRPESSGLIGRNAKGHPTVVSEARWKDTRGSAVYPPKTIKDNKVELRLLANPKIFRLIALEEYLFQMDGLDLLHGLAKAHELSHDAYGATKIRPSLDASPDIGVFLGQDRFRDMVADMARRGFDFQPVFNHHKQCVGTLELKELMKFLQNNNFSSLPCTVNREELAQRNLLSPAPPILDGTMSLHRANEIMYYGIGCVLVRYDKDRWAPDEQAYLDQHLEEGLHIFTRHDYVVSQS